MTSRDSKLVDIACEISVRTPKAIRIFDGDITEWVPLSQVEINEDDGTVTMPEWLAKEKGFI